MTKTTACGRRPAGLPLGAWPAHPLESFRSVFCSGPFVAALLPLLLLIPLWLLLVRPQQRRVRAQRAMVLSLQQGDDVLTSAGIYGTIIDLDDEVVTLEVAEGVRLRIARDGHRTPAHAAP